jgi:hypothetical protein
MEQSIKKIIVLNGYWICPKCHEPNSDRFFTASPDSTMACAKCHQLVIRKSEYTASHEVSDFIPRLVLWLLVIGGVVLSVITYFLLRK